MSERVLRITESGITIAIVTGIALFTAGYVTGQQVERQSSQTQIDRAFRAGFELGGRDHKPQPGPGWTGLLPGTGATPGIE